MSQRHQDLLRTNMSQRHQDLLRTNMSQRHQDLLRTNMSQRHQDLLSPKDVTTPEEQTETKHHPHAEPIA